ncbi:hypothetical protein BDA96_03G261600 [Sorghum bicolor]|uniref:Uncharacterized protein n=2 Tax=Sorghum bicolor TaxID=4558 RepID=A0A921RF56_SORBI|nr:hypothetical protein BDA96_03G261600 [Sorghum bicolor]KXG33019.1 hypothetical protein SORBI_3003G241600 [Sorghum bicolor]
MVEERRFSSDNDVVAARDGEVDRRDVGNKMEHGCEHYRRRPAQDRGAVLQPGAPLQIVATATTRLG